MTYTFETGVTQKDFILPLNMNFNQNEGQKDFNFCYKLIKKSTSFDEIKIIKKCAISQWR